VPQKNKPKRWGTCEEFPAEIVIWIERTNHLRHRQPRQGQLGAFQLTQVELETIDTPAQAA
jgi:hypothetical protein